MDPRFEGIFSRPENQIFNIVFFPDRIYHAQYLNATTSPRYRYYVDEVRDKGDITVLTAEVYLDGEKLAKVLRVEYRGVRLLEQMRERSRLLAPRLQAQVDVTWRAPPPDMPVPVIADRRESLLDHLALAWPRASRERIAAFIARGAITVNGRIVTQFDSELMISDVVALRVSVATDPATSRVELFMHYDPWINGYQVEVWSTLEPPATVVHDASVVVQMGYGGPITSTPVLLGALTPSARIERIEASFIEDAFSYPLGERVADRQQDTFYNRTIQVPNDPAPNSSRNTIELARYQLDFQRAWVIRAPDVAPVRYNNAMTEQAVDGVANPDFHPFNIIEMRWLLQQALGSALVYFHEVTIPPGAIEGTHQHIGSEELYYVIEGTGIIYVGVDDDPGLAAAPLVEAFVLGFGPRQLRQVEVGPGSTLFTKSGGIHGIRNPNLVPLRFVAFGYHTR